MKDKIEQAREDFRVLDHEMAAVSSTDTARLTALARERKRLEPIVAAGEEWIRLSDELASLEEMMRGGDAALAEMAQAEIASVRAAFAAKDEEMKRLLRPHDPMMDRDAIVEIRPAAGGDEAGLFAGELFRMYSRYAQNKGLSLSVFSATPTGVGGMKEVTFSLSGANAYGWFKFEQGVHRVQRVPKTEAQGRIHTSTVTVAVLPEPTEVEIKIDPKDLKVDTYRASGAGGQHVNKTESAIRITHVPTGVIVACQEERSQQQNRLRAMSLLRAKLQEAAEEKLTKERQDLRRKQVGSGDRSEKIRTYNFPQDRITDHRINFSVHNIEGFMNGDLDPMVTALQARETELAEQEDAS